MRQNLTRNFYLDEFDCKDGTRVPLNLLDEIQFLAANLQVLRDDINKNRSTRVPRNVYNIGINIVSGYRTPYYNEQIGGVVKSFHIKGKAADITCKWETPLMISVRIRRLIGLKLMKEGGIGVYPGFLHYDTRGIRARW